MGHALGAVALLAILASGGAVADESESDERRYPWISGTLDLGLELRLDDRDTDAYADQFLRFEANPPGKPKLSVHGSLWLVEDLDGHEDRTSSLTSLRDTSSTAVEARLLELYVEVDDLWEDYTLRAGRQRILESPAYTRMDGLFLKRRQGRWDWYLFGGARASIYEDAHEDAVLGGGAALRVSPRTRIAVDAFYGEDGRRDSEEVVPNLFQSLFGLGYPRRVKREVDSRQISVSVNHRLATHHHFFGRYTLYDEESDEILLSASGFFPKHEIFYDVTYRRRLEILGDRQNDVTGFYRILGTQNEFDDLLATVNIPLTERVSLGFEGQIHDARDDSSTTANRDYYRLGAFVHVDELRPDVNATLFIENWTVQDGEGTWAITGEIQKQWDRIEATIRADFERYEDRISTYEPQYFFANSVIVALVPGLYPNYRLLAPFLDVDRVLTHENIYSLEGELVYKLDERRRLEFRATYEQDDGPDSPYWRFRARYTVRF